MIVDPDFLDHWKTRMLVGLLNNDETAPLYVIRLWGHCQNRRQHEFRGMSASAIKALCRFHGDEQLLEKALTDSGFIGRNGDTLTITGWDEKNASLVASWSNGRRGGRPRKPEKPTGIPTGVPTGVGEEKRREEPPHSPPLGGGASMTLGVEDLKDHKRLAAWHDAGCPGLEPPVPSHLLAAVIATANECRTVGRRPMKLFWHKMRQLAETGQYDGPGDLYDDAKRLVAKRPKGSS